jgi:hypothetical protein
MGEGNGGRSLEHSPSLWRRAQLHPSPALWAGEGPGVRVGVKHARRVQDKISRQAAKTPRGSARGGDTSDRCGSQMALRAGLLFFGAKRHLIDTSAQALPRSRKPLGVFAAWRETFLSLSALHAHPHPRPLSRPKGGRGVICSLNDSWLSVHARNEKCTQSDPSRHHIRSFAPFLPSRCRHM